jgi:NADPH-dependent 2,4-dienoyl-CoA reductase/sulfur reductase-like enzyme
MVSERSFDVLVVGAGPAGIAAACTAAESGRRVGMIDDNPAAGGQIWRGGQERWLARLRDSESEVIADTRIIDQIEPGVLLAESDQVAFAIRYQKLILATGARERFLPFPGWTLPNVVGAGGLQALVKGGLPIMGKRVVVAGTGPLLLAVAAYLRKRGAAVPIIAEQTSLARLVRFTSALGRQPAKLVQAIALRTRLAGSRYLTGCWPVSADTKSVVLGSARGMSPVRCDYLACGFGLVPNLDLPLVVGCDVVDGFVSVNEWQETSRSGVFCAGELVGIGGLGLALSTGQIAGFTAAGRPEKARAHFAARSRAHRFRAILDRAFMLREELKNLPSPETILCRCEDVAFGSIRMHDSWRSAKLQTRCGMGPCQARVCGPAVEFLLGWRIDSVRPPIFPARLDHLAGHS